MRKRTLAVVQARMGSTRYPGKMLAALGGRPLLEWVLLRLARSEQLDDIVLATSSDSRDDLLVEVAGRCDTKVFRGDEADVLGRFCGAADACGAEWVVRVCADNPFVDPGEVDRLVAFYATSGADYACNHLDRLGSRYADGFGAEILGASLLKEIAARAVEAGHREHVTAFLWDHAEEYALQAVPAPPALAHPQLRFDVDHPADLARLEALVSGGAGIDTAAARIVELALARPAPGRVAA